MVTYFGSFPNYFQLYLDSLSINTDILSVIIFTDIDTSMYQLPENAIIINMTLDNIRERAACFLLDEYNTQIDSNLLIKRPYKLCDYKVVYHLLFCDILRNIGVNETDYIGWGDIDLIYGKLSNMINLKIDYSVIGFHGHFTAIKNNNDLKNLYSNINDLHTLLIDNGNHVIDERQMRSELINFTTNTGRSRFIMNSYFADIIPPLFSNDMFKMTTKFKMTTNNKIINHIKFDKIIESLVVVFEDGSTKEVTYAHLQKRKMIYEFKEYNIFYILKDRFSLTI